MAFFNEFKEKFASAALSVTNKTKDSVEITRLTTEHRNLSGEVNELYEELGRAYYESRGKDDPRLGALTTRIDEMHQRLEELERQKMQLRNQNRCPSCGAVMPKNARFCSSCGRRMPEAAPEAEPVLADVNYCSECGAMQKDDEPFCSVCGHRFASEAEEQPAVEVKPPVQPEVPGADDENEAPTDFNAE